MSMKKLFLPSVLALLFLSNATAQKGLTIGLKAGLNVSNINPDPYNRVKLGLHAGAYGIFKFNEKMGAGIELLYSQKGCIANDNGKAVRVVIDYIDIPMLFHYYLQPNLSIHAGFTIGVPIYTMKETWWGGTESFTQFLSNPVGLPLGITYDLGNFNIGARGELGITAIGGDGKRNNVLMATIGYSFIRDKKVGK